ncbi:MAG: hypothetical protein QXX95_03715 [Nitrososphaerales archaeon]
MKVIQKNRLALSGNEAVAYAVKQAKVDVTAVYPITPSTAVSEKISEYVAKGELDGELLLVESEHSALSACIGAAAVGARVFTVTCSQGLLLMHEILYIASALRVPVVMAVANRSISAPLNIWCDHSDAMDQRDTNWIMIFVLSVQEVYDRMIQAFRIAEDFRVRLPIMVNYDGFTLSHTYSPVDVLSDEEVSPFLPRREPPFKLDPKNPITLGAVGNPDYYMEAKVQASKALTDSLLVIDEVDKEFEKKFGRSYGIYRKFMMEDAEIAIVGMGSAMGTAKEAVRRLRKEGKKVGALILNIYRPFAYEMLAKELKDLKALGVMERALSPGGVSSPLMSDLLSTLYLNSINIPTMNFIAGLGGRDITIDDFRKMFSELELLEKGKSKRPYLTYVGLRSEEREMVL